jgi:mono/diheme cytochrome c family protein
VASDNSIGGNMKITIKITALLLFMFNVASADISATVKNDCASCHSLKKVEKDFTQRLERKGSPLYYAGNKYKEPWLTNWLQNPTTVRPGGAYPPNHTIVTDDGDIIDEKSLPKHVKLSPEKASKVTKYLMSLKGHQDLIDKVTYKPKKISKSSGRMNFVKFQGCQSCHKDSSNEGGASGPELYTSWNRLQPEYIASYIKNPQLWDKFTMMPNKHLKDSRIQKLVDYLKVLGESNEK